MASRQLTGGWPGDAPWLTVDKGMDAETADRLEGDLRHQQRRWDAGELPDAAYAASYFLLWQLHVHGRSFASRTTRHVVGPDPLAWRETLLFQAGAELREALALWLAHYRFLHVSPPVSGALRGWLLDAWPLRLMLRIPSPGEVLAMQAGGERPVTLIPLPRARQPVLGKANGFAFLVHDLEHAWKFCGEARSFRLQRLFFGLLQQAHAGGCFAPFLDDPAFADRFDYLISDMNTHPVHGLRYLHAVLIEHWLRQEGKGPAESLSVCSRRQLHAFFAMLAGMWRFPALPARALRHLAESRFTAADAVALEAGLLALAEAGVSPCPAGVG